MIMLKKEIIQGFHYHIKEDALSMRASIRAGLNRLLRN